MPWLFYIIFEILVWTPHIRYFVFGSNPVVHMAASLMNDIIWLPVALALPLYCIYLIRRVCRRLILRDGLTFFFSITWIVCAITIDLFFRLQFIFMLVFFTLWIIHIAQSRTISLKICFFSLALLGLIFHYNSQLVPIQLRRGTANLTVLTFNVNTKAAFDDERTVQFIRQRVPDIVFLQEFSGHEQRLISSALGDLYPHILSPARRYGKNDVMILSRKPIVYGDQIPLKTGASKTYHSINHAVIHFSGRDINLLNCHLHHAYNELQDYLADPDSTGLYAELEQAYIQQQEEARLLAVYAASLNGPVILAGDFNDTPNSAVYARFRELYQNAFATAGWGLGATFGQWVMQKNMPRVFRGLAFDMLRIDHIFFSKDFVIKSARVEKISAFDHHPQIVTVLIK